MADRGARGPLKISKKTFDAGLAMLLGWSLQSAVNTFFEWNRVFAVK
jgi:hypothetical protein